VSKAAPAPCPAPGGFKEKGEHESKLYSSSS